MARLLIVEDEKNLAKGMKFNFELEGYEVDVVGDGSEARWFTISRDPR